MHCAKNNIGFDKLKLPLFYQGCIIFVRVLYFKRDESICQPTIQNGGCSTSMFSRQIFSTCKGFQGYSHHIRP
jgi:hypothetical protein